MARVARLLVVGSALAAALVLSGIPAAAAEKTAASPTSVQGGGLNGPYTIQTCERNRAYAAQQGIGWVTDCFWYGNGYYFGWYT